MAGQEEIENEEIVEELPPHVMQLMLVCPNCNQKTLVYSNADRVFECGSCPARFALVRIQ